MLIFNYVRSFTTRSLIISPLVLVTVFFISSSFVLAAQLKLAWNANAESDLAGYKVYYGTGSRTYGSPINVGNVTTYTLTGLIAGQTYYIAVTAFDTAVPVNESGYSNEVSGVATDPGAVPSAPSLSSPSNGATEIATSPTFAIENDTHKIGVFRTGLWYLDANGNGTWDSGIDLSISFGNPQDKPIVGKWTSVESSVGVFRDGVWYLDWNGNDQWDGCDIDKCYEFGLASDLPVAGDWNGDGKTEIGVFQKGVWYLDYNGNGVWDGCGTDLCISFGLPTDIPVTGDWNGDGFTEVGVFRSGMWYLDYDGSDSWSGCSVDKCYSFGLPTDTPVAGDWDGSGYSKIGVKRGAAWYLDYNGNGIWDGCETDKCYSFGFATDKPVAGNW